MGDGGSDPLVVLPPKKASLLRIVLAIGLPPFLPQLAQLWITGSLDRVVIGDEATAYRTLILPGGALIGIGWAVGGFLNWWYRGRAGNALVWIAASTIAGGVGGYADGIMSSTTAALGAAGGLLVGFVQWLLLKVLPPSAEAIPRDAEAGPAGAPRGLWSWRSVCTVLAVGLPPLLPYVALLVLADMIVNNLTIERYEIVRYSHVAFAMIPVAWILGGFMVRRNFERRWGPVFWPGLFAAIGTMLGFSMMGIGRDYVLYALGSGTLAGLLVWLTLWATRPWHGRSPGSLFAWVVASASVAVAGALMWIGLPVTSYFFMWMFPAVGAGGGAVIGLTMWEMLRWAR